MEAQTVARAQAQPVVQQAVVVPLCQIVLMWKINQVQPEMAEWEPEQITKPERQAQGPEPPEEQIQELTEAAMVAPEQVALPVMEAAQEAQALEEATQAAAPEVAAAAVRQHVLVAGTSSAIIRKSYFLFFKQLA